MSLYKNINKRKKAGTSRSKKNSTISKKAYANMKAGFPKKKKMYGGKMKKMCDVIIIPSKSTEKIQETHIMIGHIVCSIVEHEYFSTK